MPLKKMMSLSHCGRILRRGPRLQNHHLEVVEKLRKMKVARASVVSVLIKHFPKEKAVNYEKAIFNSAVSKIVDGLPDVDFYAGLAYERIAQFIGASNEMERLAIIVDMQNNGATEEVAWSAAIYENHREKHDATLQRSQQRPKPVRGMHICKDPACKSDEFYMWSLQTKGGDEGMTHFRQCTRCGKRGKE